MPIQFAVSLDFLPLLKVQIPLPFFVLYYVIQYTYSYILHIKKQAFFMHHVSEDTIEFLRFFFQTDVPNISPSVPTSLIFKLFVLGGDESGSIVCYGFSTRHLKFLMIFFHKIIRKSSILNMCIVYLFNNSMCTESF